MKEICSIDKKEHEVMYQEEDVTILDCGHRVAI